MSVRRTFALALVAGVAASTFQAQPASAVCWVEYRKVTGDCNPCYTVAPIYYKVTGDHLLCLA